METIEFRVILPDFLRFSALTLNIFPLSFFFELLSFFLSSTFIDSTELARPFNSCGMLSFGAQLFSGYAANI